MIPEVMTGSVPWTEAPRPTEDVALDCGEGEEVPLLPLRFFNDWFMEKAKVYTRNEMAKSCYSGNGGLKTPSERVPE